jgi:hypothetical protein
MRSREAVPQRDHTNMHKSLILARRLLETIKSEGADQADARAALAIAGILVPGMAEIPLTLDDQTDAANELGASL